MNKRITILGAGESGTGAALLAKAKGYAVFVSDMGVIADKNKQLLEKEGIEYEEGGHTIAKILHADIIVKSPGIPNSAQVVQQAVANNIEIIDELEFAYRFTNAKIIAITGTNGKTTTTLLTYHLLKEAGLKVGLAGNVGSSMAKQVIDDDFDYYVVEMSSFQIDGINSFSPDVAVLLNITPDHLDRYNNDFEQYINSKLRLMENMKQGSKMIYYADDKVVADKLAVSDIEADMLPISLYINDHHAAQAVSEEMHFTLPEAQFQVKQSDTTLKGKHNIINTMAAVLAAQFAGVSVDAIKTGLRTFQNAPHRLEYVATINDVAFYNDSKATNVESTKYALESFDEKLVWIAGGIDKGNDYSKIMEQVNAKVKALVCLGKDNEKLRDAFHNQIMGMLETDNMTDAVNSAMQYAKAHDSVLLSPACASFDLFKNYEDRGDQFKEAVMLLKKTYDN